MAHTFRLIRAGGAARASKLPSTGTLYPTVVFSDPNEPAGSECSYSIVIGNNGSGKSRLLGNIASEFARMYSRRAGRDRYAQLGCLEYFADATRVDLDNRFLGSLSLEDLEKPRPLPSRVIAVALTPVDKFPLEGNGM